MRVRASVAAAAVVTLVALLPLVATPPVDAEPVREIRQAVASADPAWTIHWQARVSERGGQFRLYRGADLHALEIVDIQEAAAGLGGYRYRDLPGDLARQYYQLRYVTSAGHEIVLGLLRIDRVGLQHAPATVVGLTGGGGKALVQCQPPLAQSCRRLPLSPSLAEHASRRPEPEVPPPRGAA